MTDKDRADSLEALIWETGHAVYALYTAGDDSGGVVRDALIGYWESVIAAHPNGKYEPITARRLIDQFRGGWEEAESDS